MLTTAIQTFIDSVRIERIDFKITGGILTPRFNILSNAPPSSNPNHASSATIPIRDGWHRYLDPSRPLHRLPLLHPPHRYVPFRNDPWLEWPQALHPTTDPDMGEAETPKHR